MLLVGKTHFLLNIMLSLSKSVYRLRIFLFALLFLILLDHIEKVISCWVISLKYSKSKPIWWRILFVHRGRRLKLRQVWYFLKTFCPLLEWLRSLVSLKTAGWVLIDLVSPPIHRWYRACSFQPFILSSLRWQLSVRDLPHPLLKRLGSRSFFFFLDLFFLQLVLVCCLYFFQLVFQFFLSLLLIKPLNFLDTFLALPCGFILFWFFLLKEKVLTLREGDHQLPKVLPCLCHLKNQFSLTFKQRIQTTS